MTVEQGNYNAHVWSYTQKCEPTGWGGHEGQARGSCEWNRLRAWETASARGWYRQEPAHENLGVQNSTQE